MVDPQSPYRNTKLQVKQLEELIDKLPDLHAATPAAPKQPLPRKKTYISPEHESEIVASYQAGASVYELGRKFKIHRNTVSRILKRHGVEMRMQGLSPAQIDQAAGLYNSGWSLARVGSKFGVDAGTVRARLVERGVRMRDTHGRER